MAIESTSTVQGSPQTGARGYESRDANVPWILGIVAFLFCSGIVIHLVLAGVLNHLNKTPPAVDAWRLVELPPRQPQRTSFPRLQVSSRMDLAEFHAREDEDLTNYGWINRTSGVVRVPVERAIELVLQKGLPVRTNLVDRAGPSPAQLIERRLTGRQPEIREDK
jgi:hypothetical protein